MCQERLANLAIISIESDSLQTLVVDLLINQFTKDEAFGLNMHNGAP